ncbi:hypothetical protein EAX61_14050 [Dokdonia sinensis]|uniref:Uncharacterized protein n=1 Tax=Dokdonia sinensis TaxID=2479847 RepID=A0A3M0FX50_9FLAO|nr:hypothetical protein [Dokdonia sinensis]RMB56527.1 hypothetical protein EAX61_14050 [Dokdonia sinensis]
MKIKNIFIICLLLSTAQCKSQNSASRLSIKEKDTEAFVTFFNTQKMYSYIDKNVMGADLILNFIGRYKHNIKFYRTADSICKKDQDLERLKFYCPLADSFSRFEGLLDASDFEYLRAEYESSRKPRELNVESIISQTIPLLKHSDIYYEQVDYTRYDGVPKIDEFPSIRVLDYYITKNEDVAIIVYVTEGPGIRHGRASYFLLKKMDDIWWKPIGPLKI